MKRIMTILLVLGSLVVTACTKPGGGGTVQAGGEAPAPAPRADARPASVGGIFKGTVKRGYEITFEVSPDGKQVTKVAANVLETCTGASASRTTQLYWDGPFTVGDDGAVISEGEDPEFKGIQYRFTARFGADGTATGTVLQKGAGCTTYELEWTAKRE